MRYKIKERLLSEESSRRLDQFKGVYIYVTHADIVKRKKIKKPTKAYGQPKRTLIQQDKERANKERKQR